jgi:hypothetical protein
MFRITRIAVLADSIVSIDDGGAKFRADDLGHDRLPETFFLADHSRDGRYPFRQVLARRVWHGYPHSLGSCGPTQAGARIRRFQKAQSPGRHRRFGLHLALSPALNLRLFQLPDRLLGLGPVLTPNPERASDHAPAASATALPDLVQFHREFRQVPDFLKGGI